MRASRKSAANAHVKSDLSRLGPSGSRADIVDLRVRAPVAATRDGNLEFARQVGVVGVPIQETIDRKRERGCIYQFVRFDACKWTSCNGPSVVSARTHAPPAYTLQLLPYRWHVFDSEPVQLEVLPVRDVEATASVSVGQVRDCTHHLRREDSVGRTEAHHEERHLLPASASSV